MAQPLPQVTLSRGCCPPWAEGMGGPAMCGVRFWVAAGLQLGLQLCSLDVARR